MKLKKNNDLHKNELINIINYILSDRNSNTDNIMDYLEIEMSRVDFDVLERNLERQTMEDEA